MYGRGAQFVQDIMALVCSLPVTRGGIALALVKRLLGFSPSGSGT